MHALHFDLWSHFISKHLVTVELGRSFSCKIIFYAIGLWPRLTPRYGNLVPTSRGRRCSCAKTSTSVEVILRRNVSASFLYHRDDRCTKRQRLIDAQNWRVVSSVPQRRNLVWRLNQMYNATPSSLFTTNSFIYSPDYVKYICTPLFQAIDDNEIELMLCRFCTNRLKNGKKYKKTNLSPSSNLSTSSRSWSAITRFNVADFCVSSMLYIWDIIMASVSTRFKKFFNKLSDN